jgi:hypothetical protein
MNSFNQTTDFVLKTLTLLKVSCTRCTSDVGEPHMAHRPCFDHPCYIKRDNFSTNAFSAFSGQSSVHDRNLTYMLCVLHFLSDNFVFTVVG